VGVEVEGGLERIVFEDDGAGMSLADARAHLFRLYASSKEQEADSAGRSRGRRRGEA
jgi:DNA mismatch repair ATPase MutL